MLTLSLHYDKMFVKEINIKNMSSTTIQIRIDEKEKRAAQNILDKLGIDMSSAIKMFLNQLKIHKGIPFRLVTENGFTPKEEKEILKVADEARRGINVTKPMNTKEAIEFLDSL